MKFFFYGIFLEEKTRQKYGIEGKAHYATLAGYATYGEHIVEAIKQETKSLALTGLVVDVPEEAIPTLDVIETGYNRVSEITEQGEEVQLYASHYEF